MKTVKGLASILGISVEEAREKAKVFIEKMFEIVGGKVYEKYQGWKEWKKNAGENWEEFKDRTGEAATQGHFHR